MNNELAEYEDVLINLVKTERIKQRTFWHYWNSSHPGWLYNFLVNIKYLFMALNESYIQPFFDLCKKKFRRER